MGRKPAATSKRPTWAPPQCGDKSHDWGPAYVARIYAKRPNGGACVEWERKCVKCCKVQVIEKE